MAPGPSAQRHRPISHGHTQTVNGLPVSQPAQPSLGNPQLFRSNKSPANHRALSFPNMHCSLLEHERMKLLEGNMCDTTERGDTNPNRLAAELCYSYTTQFNPKVSLLPSSFPRLQVNTAFCGLNIGLNTSRLCIKPFNPSKDMYFFLIAGNFI